MGLISPAWKGFGEIRTGMGRWPGTLGHVKVSFILEFCNQVEMAKYYCLL